MLEPVTVTLHEEEYTAVLNHVEDLSKAGFEVEDFGTGTVLVRVRTAAVGWGRRCGSRHGNCRGFGFLEKPHDHGTSGLGVPQCSLPCRYEGGGFLSLGRGDDLPGGRTGSKIPMCGIVPMAVRFTFSCAVRRSSGSSAEREVSYGIREEDPCSSSGRPHSYW